MPPTPTDYPHTPEPWAAKHDRIFAVDPIDGAPSQVAMTTYSAFTWEQEEANATRIAACVNACAGLNDPGADIARLRRIAAWACALVADIDGGDSVNLTDALDTVRPLLSFEED